MLFYNILLHIGTCIAIFLVLRSEIINIFKSAISALSSPRSIKTKFSENNEFRIFVLIIIGCIPTGFIGYFFKDFFEKLFESALFASFALIVTGIILLLTKLKLNAKHKEKMGILDSILVGIAQGLAIVPGFSRSGLTIATGIFRNIKPAQAASFAFLVAVPAIIGALILEVSTGVYIDKAAIIQMIMGTIVSIVTGYFALRIVIKLTILGKLHYFSFYCFFAAIVGIAIFI